MSDETQPESKSTAFNMRRSALLFAVSITFIVLAGICEYFSLFPFQVVRALVALGISLILFGLLESTAKVTLPNVAGVPMGKGVSLGGAVAGFYLVFTMLDSAPESAPPGDSGPFDIVFRTPLYLDTDNAVYDKEKLQITQMQPFSSSFSDYPIVPVGNVGNQWGTYKIPERRLVNIGDRMHVVAKRKVMDAFTGAPATVPRFNMCFERASEQSIVADLECDEAECAVTSEALNIKACADSQLSQSPALTLFPYVYAQDPEVGWIAPSLDTLVDTREEKGITYVAFSVSSDALQLPQQVDSFTYYLAVNGVPIYLNGWEEFETRRSVTPTAPFEFHFGLQNLDFSGADYGKENLYLRFTYYQGDTVVRTDELTRDHIALRAVTAKEVVLDEVTYQWSGQQYFGNDDGFEVFFWSSEDASELVNRRKRFFDDEDVMLDGADVVAVIRPPLGQNRHYGLVLGIKDRLGRIDFTFPEQRAEEIAHWASQNLLNRRTRVRPETGFDHPLIKEVNIYPLNGH